MLLAEGLDFPDAKAFNLEQVEQYLAKIGKDAEWQKEFLEYMAEMAEGEGMGLDEFIYREVFYTSEEIEEEAVKHLNNKSAKKIISVMDYDKKLKEIQRLSWDVAAKHIIDGYIEEFNEVYAARKSVKQHNKETGINLDI